MKIKAYPTNNPTPKRSWDWAAYDSDIDGQDEDGRDYSTHPVGNGATREEAIADLKEQIADRADGTEEGHQPSKRKHNRPRGERYSPSAVRQLAVERGVGRPRQLDALASEMRRQVSDSVDRYLDLGNRWHALQLGIASGKVELLSNYRRAK